MCGIAGWAGGSEADDALGRRCDAIAHREARRRCPSRDEVLALSATRGVDRCLARDAAYLPGDLHVKVHRMSMGHALEVRSPLLDHEVHEFAARTPPAIKLRRGMTKWILKEFAPRRGLPVHLATRGKKAFGIPIGEWFRGDLRPWIEGVLRESATTDRGYFRPAETGACSTTTWRAGPITRRACGT